MNIDIQTLNKIRKEKRISYDELAKMTGYSRSTITNIFCGYVKYPRHETMQAIYEALGIVDSNMPYAVLTLIKLRIEAGISQEEMAQLLDLDLKTYIAIESGVFSIASEHIKIICEKFNISEEELLGANVGEIKTKTIEQLKAEIKREVEFIDIILSNTSNEEKLDYYYKLSEFEKDIFVEFLLTDKVELQNFREMLLSIDIENKDILGTYLERPDLWERKNK